MTSFTHRVLDVVRAIPAGSVMSYKDVAKAAGSPGAARAVGNIMKQNYNSGVPCHRVIKSNGELGEYNRGAARKEAILRRGRAL